ncbi:hypothetical protein GW17_00040318, partial [Ensete ventricosum]
LLLEVSRAQTRRRWASDARNNEEMQQPEDAADAKAAVTRQGNAVVCRTQVHYRGAPMMAVGIDETVFCCSELRPPASQREPR